MLSYYVTSLGLVPFFTSRAFTPLFASALLARAAPHWTWLADLPGSQMLKHVPSWATSGPTLLALFVLALTEVAAAKSPDFRALLSLVDTKIKGAAAFLVCFAMVRGNPVELLEHVEKVGISTHFAWGQSFAYTWAFAIGSVVWLTAVLRNAIFGFLMEVDEDDDLGLQKLLSWLEDGMGFFGVLFVVIFPTLALIVFGLTVLGLYLTRRYLERREQRSKLPCPECGHPNPPCGIRCAACGGERTPVQKVGPLGTIRPAMATDLFAHRHHLLAHKRCPNCGERLKERRLQQHCAECATQPFADSAEVDLYLERIRAGLPKTLTILFVLGFVPVLGLIPGVVYYRLSIVASLRAYLPRTTGFGGRWIVPAVNLVLICLQPIPIVGMFTLPSMCLANYWVYQGLLRRRSRRELTGSLLPAAAAA